MGMTFEDLRNLFESYTKTDHYIDNAQLALWFNEAALDLAYDLAPVQKVEITPADGGVFTPGEDWLVIVASDMEYERKSDGSLVFPQGGNGYLYYRAVPPLFTGTELQAECGLPEAARYLPALFAAARYWDTESDGSAEETAMANRWLSYYYQGKNLAKSRYDLSRVEIERWLVRQE